MFGWFDPMYLLFLAPALILSLWAQWKVKSTFEKYSNVRTRRGMRGVDAANAILRAAQVEGVTVERAQGYLTDHYHPLKKTLALSEPVYDSTSISAIGVAAHEAGHAIQHKYKYLFLMFRSAWVPVASIGSGIAPILFMVGFALSAWAGSPKWGDLVMQVSIGLFGAFTVFTLVTLPVEFNASSRAVAILKETGIVSNAEEEKGVRDVLWAAGMTYVAAAATALMTLLYYIMRYQGSRSRD